MRALEYGTERVKTLPVSIRLIRELHEKLMEGVRGEAATPGEFRTRQNWIGRPGSLLNDASYVPPPVPEMMVALGELELYLHRADDPYPPLVRLAFVHYQFEAIHPFVDGNGRIGRLLLALLLVEWGLLPLPLLYLSAFFEQHRVAYYEGLAGVTRDGNWREWTAYFMSGVREQSRDAVARLRALADLREEWRERGLKARASALSIRLLDQLFVTPVVTIPQVSEHLGIGYQSAKNNVLRLVAQDILRPAGGEAYNQRFQASQIIQILQRSQPEAE